MIRRFLLILTNTLLINLGFLLTFFIRYGLPFPESNFLPYKNTYLFLTVIYIGLLAVLGVYKNRFKSSWELFRKVFLAVFLGTLLSVAFVYVFRAKWGAFPTSVFAISFFVNLLLVFKVNQFVLKAKKKIKKQVIILGEGKVDDIVGKKAIVERKRIDQIRELLEYPGVDEIIVSEKMTNAEDLNLLLYLGQKLKAEILFSPSVYMVLLSEIINGNSSVELLGTFVGRQTDAVKPGLTGLAQIRNFYDLHPKHKIRYDFLYIQRRSLWLNVYILLKTIPVLFSKKGW